MIPLGRLPAWHAARDPKRRVLTHGDDFITRAEFDARTNRRARALAAFGIEADDLVTLSLPNGFEFFETTFALWKLGATPNVVSSKLPDVELQAIVDLVRPKVVIGVDPSRLPGYRVVPAAFMPDPMLSAEPLPEIVAAHWKAMTSGGSTGRPKVILDARPGSWERDFTVLGQQVDDVLLNPGPLYHNAPFTYMHAGLFVGGHVIEMGKFDALGALAAIERHRVQWVTMVPTMMHRIWRLSEAERHSFDLSSLRVFSHMAAACPVWLKQAYIDWLGPERIWELYGGTEQLGRTTITGTEWLAHRGSVGRIQPGSRVKIIHETGRECKTGEVGEIFFLPDSGCGTTYRYIGAEARRSGEWESLGDLGHLDADGYLYLADRRTDLIITGGANVYPAEIEAALNAHPQVLDCVAIGMPDDDLGHRIHAIVQVSADAEPAHAETIEGLKTFLETRLVRYKIPRSFELTAEPLRDEAGKVRRSQLRNQRLG